MLIGGVVGVVLVAAVIVAAFVRSRSHDDEHSVQHYHRQLHTLEEIRTHPTPGRQESNGDAAFPASAFRVAGSTTVRLTEPGHTLVPPVPPPSVPNPAEPVKFDDDGAEAIGTSAPSNSSEAPDSPDSAPSTFMTGNRDKAMHGINHRPRRLGGPLLAVAAVAVVVAVLIATGLHTNANNKHHGKASTTATTTHTTSPPARGHPTTSRRTTTTTTTTPPAVSAPQFVSAHAATYQVSSPNYSLVLAATTGECWVEATNSTTGAVLFTTTLFSGQSHTIPATGPVTVIAGAPGAFSATINGTAVALPPGNQAPFTLHFLMAGASGATGSTGTGGSGGTPTSAPTTPTT